MVLRCYLLTLCYGEIIKTYFCVGQKYFESVCVCVCLLSSCDKLRVGVSAGARAALAQQRGGRVFLMAPEPSLDSALVL